MISIIGFGVFTFLIACLPGYATIGLASLALFILLRFIGGVFVGDWGVLGAAQPAGD